MRHVDWSPRPMSMYELDMVEILKVVSVQVEDRLQKNLLKKREDREFKDEQFR